MIIDAHLHISLFEDNAKNLEDAFMLLLKDMNNNKINYAIIIPDNIEKLPNIADLKKAIKLIKGHKNIFLLGSPQIIQRGSSEIKKYEKLIKNKIIKGIKFFPGHDPYYPINKKCFPYYELCQKLDVPVLFHTGENSGDGKCAKWNDPKYIVKIAKKYPKLKVIITHYYWPKLDYCYKITKNIPNIYFELAAIADKEVIKKSGGINKIKKILIKTISDRPDKVFYGTDWPMCKMKNHIKLVKELGLSKEMENKIFYKNAIEIYKLPIKSIE